MTTQVQPKIITNQPELLKLIQSISVAGKKVDSMIQLAGVSALAHLKEHGDIGMVNRLYLALHKGARKAALSSWLLAHGAIVANTEPSKAEKPFNNTKDKTTNVEAAQADTWYNHKPDQEPDQVYDLAKAINAIIKKASTAKEVTHSELLTQLQAMVTIPEAADQASE